MYKIGDTVNFGPEALRYCKSHGFIKTKSVPGVVVWIHPQRRFYSVEFTFTRGGVTRSFRQAYPLRNRITASTCDIKPETLSEKPKHPRGAVDQISKPVAQGAYFPVKKQKRGKRKK